MVAVIRENAAPTKADFHAAIASRSGHWYSACLRITHDEDLAADAVQDALLSAWNKRHQFEASARLETWIHRIAINAALQLLRKRHPERFEPLDFEVEDGSDAPDENQANAELGTRLSAPGTERHTVPRMSTEVGNDPNSNVGQQLGAAPERYRARGCQGIR